MRIGFRAEHDPVRPGSLHGSCPPWLVEFREEYHEMRFATKSRIRRWTPYLFLAPMVLVLLALVYYPTLSTVIFGFQKMDLVNPQLKGFAALQNYRGVLENPVVWSATLNSAVILALVLVATVIGGLAAALVMARDSIIKGMLTAIVILPWALPPVVNGILWRWMFHPAFGIVNKMLLRLGVIHESIQWLTTPSLVLFVVSLVVTWKTLPLAALLFLSGLQSIPTELHEGSVLDGANVFQEFRFITLPLLMPVLVIVVTLTSISGFSLFDEIVSFTGFSFQTSAIMVQIYVETFRFLNFGKGSALVTLFMVVTGALAFFYIRALHRRTEYL
jgi:multiple sugar transport system permease protein